MNKASPNDVGMALDGFSLYIVITMDNQNLNFAFILLQEDIGTLQHAMTV